MTNNEMMQQQIDEVAKIMKSLFTDEEIKQIEKDFDKKIKELNEKGVGDNKSNRKIY